MNRKGIAGALAGLLLSLSMGLHAAEPIDINTADAAQLASALNGIGPAKAQEIVRYREQHGPFKSVDELIGVKGVGESLLARNRDRIAPLETAPAQ